MPAMILCRLSVLRTFFHFYSSSLEWPSIFFLGYHNENIQNVRKCGAFKWQINQNNRNRTGRFLYLCKFFWMIRWLCQNWFSQKRNDNYNCNSDLNNACILINMKIMNRNQSFNTKMSTWQTRKLGNTRGGIMYVHVGGVSIPCWPVTPAVSQ